MNKRISFPLKRISVATATIKDSFKIYFHEMEKLFPVERMFEKLKQNGFH